MKNRTNVPAALLSGAVGAVCLTVLHELTRKTVPHPPRVDIIGMRALAKLAGKTGQKPPRNLRNTALAGDLVGNTLYYSTVAAAGPENALVNGALAGAAAGIGVLLLPGPLGLGDAEVNRTLETEILAFGFYFAAGLIAGWTYKSLSRANSQM